MWRTVHPSTWRRFGVVWSSFCRSCPARSAEWAVGKSQKASSFLLLRSQRHQRKRNACASLLREQAPCADPTIPVCQKAAVMIGSACLLFWGRVVQNRHGVPHPSGCGTRRREREVSPTQVEVLPLGAERSAKRRSAPPEAVRFLCCRREDGWLDHHRLLWGAGTRQLRALSRSSIGGGPKGKTGHLRTPFVRRNTPFRVGYQFHDQELVVLRILNWPKAEEV